MLDINSYTGIVIFYCPDCGKQLDSTYDKDVCPTCGYDSNEEGWDTVKND